MIDRKHVVAALSAAVFAVPHPALAAQAAPQPANSRVENWLRDRFGEVVKSCLVGATAIKLKSKIAGTNSKEVSPVPSGISDWVRTNPATGYSRLGASGVTRHFGYVFSANEVAAGPGAPMDAGRFLLDSYDHQIDAHLLKGEATLATFHQTCDSLFSVGLKTGIGFSDETIKAAGGAATSGTKKVRADAAAGKFVSPFVTAFQAATASDKAFVSFLFWEWRARHGAEDGYLIRQFDGIALSRSVESDLSATVNASVTASPSFLPFLSIKGNADGSYSDRSNYKIETFEVVATGGFDNTLQSRFKIPAEQELNDNIAALDPKIAYGEGGNVLVANLPNVAFIDVPAMPERMCRETSEYSATDVTNGSIDISGSEYRTTDGICRFTITYTGATSQNARSVSVPFSIHRRARAGLVGFSIPVKRLQFTSTDRPKLDPALPAYKLESYSALPTFDLLTWRVSGAVWDDDQLRVGAVTADLKLADDCGLPAPMPKLTGDMTLSNDQAGKIDFELVIKTRLPTNAANDITDPAKPQRFCRVTGELRYPVGAGKSVYRPITDEIYLKVPG